MLILNGKNLGERQRDLNQKVLEAAVKKIDLNTLRSEDNISDADKLFQIDLASRYRNLDFIVNMLKSGDSLCITRALKCSWLYDDKYSDIINTDFLHQNIFPFMSLRMKKKMLTAISLHVRHEERVVKFYSYCVSSKFKKLALKFLVYTPECFKMDLIQSDDDFNCFDNPKSLKHFIGNSFALALAYIKMHSCKERIKVIYELRFLYTEFKYDYMEVLERYAQIDNGTPYSINRLGIRISTDILKNNKRRIWDYPLIYINLLNKTMLIKYLTSEDVKSIGALLLPNSAKSFWAIDFYHSYSYILDLIPPTERFAYLKEIFTSKYKNKSFEFNIQFYNFNYYELLTTSEQESWALLNIEREEELFGSGRDYIWYKFVRFDVAFEEIKKYVFVTPDGSTRANIINILVYSAKNQEDLIKLLNYYYERHVNEGEEYKNSFLDLIISEHDVYAFTINCWEPFNKLLYSLEIYNTYCTDWHNKYVLISMIYHILNEKEFTEDLKQYIEVISAFYDFNDIINSLSTDRKSLVVKFLMNFHVEKLKILLQLPHDNKIEEDIVDRIHHIWSLIWTFKRDESECPEIVMTYMKSNMKIYENHPALKKKFEAMSEEDFVRLLKSDSQKVIDSVSKVECNAHRWSFKLNRLLRKLKVYFSLDVSEIYLKYFMDSFETLSESPSRRIYRNIKMAVVGVLHLGNEGEKEKMLEKYVPVRRKIDHFEIDRYVYQVQKAICRLVYQSRPPVQLPIIMKYLKGDYVRFCLPLFYHYFANLPMPRALEFIYETINSPISVQKHGLRLAFKYFSSEDLAHIILQIWKKTNNKSLRMLLYKTLFDRMLDEDDDSQKALYDVFKFYSSNLDHQDHQDVFDLLVSDDIPEYFKGDLIETAWQTLSKFSNKKINLVRKTSIINHMRKNIYSVKRQFIRDNIIDDHVRTVLYENRLITTYSSQELEEFMNAKWALTATYVASGNTTLEILENSKELADNILTKFLEMWDHQYKGAYTYRTPCNIFLSTLHYESCENPERYLNLIIIYRRILEILQDNWTNDALYLAEWFYKLSIKSRRVIYKHHVEHNDCIDYKYPCVVEVAIAFAKKVGKLVQGLVESDKFYHSLYADMANALNNACETTGEIIGTSPNGFKILFSGLLTEYKLKETHALAVMVMPKSPPKYWEKRHENALDMIRQYDNEEIRCKLYQKFAPSYDTNLFNYF